MAGVTPLLPPSHFKSVLANAGHLADKANPRFVVTSLPADIFSATWRT